PIAWSLGAAIAAPVGLYFAFALFRLARFGGSVAIILLVTLVVLAGIAMFFALIRALMLGLRQIHQSGGAAERSAIVAIALILPLAGLGLNRLIPFPVDFQAAEVYALATI